MCKLLHKFKRYRIGQPKNEDVKRSKNLFLDDLNVYQESHKTLKDITEMILQESNNTGACYRVGKSAKIVFEKVKMVNERMKTIDTEEHEICQFLGVTQADGKIEVYNKVRSV